MKEYEGLEWWDTKAQQVVFTRQLKFWLRYWGYLR